MDIILNVFNSFASLMKTFRSSDLLDISVMSFIIYHFIKLVRDTRASQLVKGIIILIAVFFLSSQLNLRMLSNLLNKFFEFGILALLVVFQPELRRALEQIGRSKISKYWLSASAIGDALSVAQLQRLCIDAVVNATTVLQKSKTGALIVFERSTKLGDIIDTGTILNAHPSVPIIGNIFFNKAPLHDGAMIVRDGLVCAAGCILPLTKNENINSDLGTRHRAALGISEVSDAVAVVVSEETGVISVAVNGVLTSNYSSDNLRNTLSGVLLSPDRDSRIARWQILESFRRVKK